MKRIDLFSVPIWKTKIDPSTYRKADLIAEVEANYAKAPKRNKWDLNGSNLHHSYNDWGNPDFVTPQIPELLNQYQIKIKEFMDGIKFHQEKTNWVANFTNITAMKTGQYMDTHDHIGSPTSFYTATHYVQFDKSHNSTCFINPSIAAIYDQTLHNTRNRLQYVEENTGFFTAWEEPAEEDDLIIFPSFLKHKVRPNGETDVLRIVGVLNVDLV